MNKLQQAQTKVARYETMIEEAMYDPCVDHGEFEILSHCYAAALNELEMAKQDLI